ncbi:MAG: MFS transporter [Yaniella sp.]|uniref:MFS transporter n=1 Tax=Yaniella sp. TaxID=2773929 RepID=UPI002649B0D3|nr:MFS transporter [Yaniella sp.]MDN5704770.1 MFS transporter [Yaniella sp.]MDN5732135.1 MFS transporter [Yaniella sp.]MDN5742193.1 MFS transporter [Yaniella sp.]MDN5815979.1 MFS transporter [Yaniella sp.]MDN5818661.1 MFS transporter [Yaniella sp.]
MTQKRQLPPAGRSALKAGVVGNWVDNLHVFLPALALIPALPTLAGPGAHLGSGAMVVVAMLLGRPVGGLVFGRLSDRLGRTVTTRWAIAGTALCTGLIAVMPGYEVLGIWTMVFLLMLRFIGGVFVAGEYSAAIPLAMEWSPANRRSTASGAILSMAPWAQGSVAFGTAGLLAFLGTDTYAQWGWRVLFGAAALASVGMFIYYWRHVVDQHVPTKSAAEPLMNLLTGSYARRFWSAFVMMTGLWLLTQVTVLILPSQLIGAGLMEGHAAIIMGVASVFQALFMVVAGVLADVWGRRRLLVTWGVIALFGGPLLYTIIISGPGATAMYFLAAGLQISTVAAYGPVAAYLSELFPASLRSAGYGSAYSISLVLPALYPFYLPAVQQIVGEQPAIIGMLLIGAVLLIAGAMLGPRLAPSTVQAPLEEVATISSNTTGAHIPQTIVRSQ